MTDEPPSGHVFRPERDKRVHDAERFLHDRRLEAEAMIGLWERSIKITAPDELRYWRAVLAEVRRKLRQLEDDRSGG